MVEILNYEVVNKNKTIGYVDIRVPITKPTVLIFRRIAHVQNGKRTWFSLPTLCRENEDGTPQFFSFSEFETKANNTCLLNSLDEKVKEYCKEHEIQVTEVLDFEKFPEEQTDGNPF